MYDLEVELKK